MALVARVIESERTLIAMQATLVEMLASLLDGGGDEIGPPPFGSSPTLRPTRADETPRSRPGGRGDVHGPDL